MLTLKCAVIYKCSQSLLRNCMFHQYTTILDQYKAAAHYRELKLIFSTNDLQMSVRVFVLVETLKTYTHHDFEC